MAKTRVTFTLDEETVEKLREASKETDIPQARIVEKAILERVEKLLK